MGDGGDGHLFARVCELEEQVLSRPFVKEPDSLNQSLTHTLTHPLIHSPTHSLTRRITRLPTCSLVCRARVGVERVCELEEQVYLTLNPKC